MSLWHRLIIALLAFVPVSATANSIIDHAFSGFSNPRLTTTLTEIPTLLIDGKLDEVISRSQSAQAWLTESNLSREEQARGLSNLAIYLSQAGAYNEALLASNQAEEILENISPFHPDLYHVLMAKGYILVWEDAHEDAVDALRHAQHIAHRNQGVYARNQIPTLRLLTDVQFNSGRRKDADQTQRFFLKVNEQIFGAASEEMVPSLTEAGHYFANRGRIIPSGNRSTNVFMVGRNRTIELDPSEDISYRARIFRESERAFERSIAIIEDKYGENDLRLVELLKGLSHTKFLEGFARTHSEKPMEKMVAIVHQNPGSDVGDKARALVELADLYIKTEDSRAAETYQQAWALLEGPEMEDLRYELFGRPVRIWPDHNLRPTLDRHPVDAEPGAPLYVNLNYNVAENGRVRQVNVVDSNIPLRKQKEMRVAMQLMKFRPRMVDGQLVATEGLALRQSYIVIKPEPEFQAELTTTP